MTTAQPQFLTEFLFTAKHKFELQVGEIVIDDAGMRTVVALGWEQGSGPTPSRYSVAFDDGKIETFDNRNLLVVVAEKRANAWTLTFPNNPSCLRAHTRISDDRRGGHHLSETFDYSGHVTDGCRIYVKGRLTIKELNHLVYITDLNGGVLAETEGGKVIPYR